MDWALAIDRNRTALLRIVATLFSLVDAASISVGGSAGLRVPRHVWLAVLLVLRPAESAVRRLIVIAARALVLPARKQRDIMVPSGPNGPVLNSPLFKLLDTLPGKMWEDWLDDDAGSFGSRVPLGSASAANDRPVECRLLHNRLRALRLALNDLDRQARRLARWKAKRNEILHSRPFRATRICPMRPGLPAGWRARSLHEVDDLLRECHRLALDCLTDTS